MRSQLLYRLKAAFSRVPGPWKPKSFLLRGENLRAELTPHPLSFLDFHTPFIYLLVVGLGFAYLFNAVTGWVSFEDFLGYQAGVTAIRLLVWSLALVVFAIGASVILIRWTYLATFAAFIAGALWISIQAPEAGGNPFFLPVYSTIMALIGMALVDIYRRSHTYVITDLRLILKAGILRKRERTVRYENVTDLATSQGILGRIFGYGSITPITASGIGTGADEAFAGGGVGAATPEGQVGGGLFAGGSKKVRVARARSYSELHGIHPFRTVRILMAQLLQESSMVHYAKEQRDLLAEMRDIMVSREEPDYYYAYEQE